MSISFLPFIALTFTLATPASMPPAPTLPGGTGGIVLTCPDTAKLVCGFSIDPKETGVATATTTCVTSPNVTISHTDAPGFSTGCPADRFHANIMRTWTATDACGSSASCVQEIHVLRQIWNLDALPGACPNVIDTNSGPSTITLAVAGTSLQNVANIVQGSVRVYTENCADGPAAPVQVSVADITRPFGGAVCDCQSLGADGVSDLKLDFNRTSLVNALHLGTVAAGGNVRLVVTGTLTDGCTFIALDCIQVTHAANEGCSLGYWKNHVAAWAPTGFHPNDDFDTVFGVNAFQPNRTLLQALQAGGGGINNLGRQGVAALLSASHPSVHFPLTQAQVISMVHDAVINGTAGTVASQLEVFNLGACPLN